MKQRIKRAVAFLLVLCMVSSSNLILPVKAEELDTSTLPVFTENVKYEMNKKLEKAPNVFTAKIRFDESYYGKHSSYRGGVILGNRSETENEDSISFEIVSKGHPHLSMTTADGVTGDWTFNQVNVYTDSWIDLAIVRDTEKNEVRCYVDDELAQTLPADFDYDVTGDSVLVLGGDHRANNSQYFKGYIASAAIYTDVKQNDVIAEYNLVNAATKNGQVVQDNGDNDYDLSITQVWIEPADKTPLKDYAYSMAIIGDTQRINVTDNGDKLPVIYDWIKDNATEKNIKAVLHMGDLTDLDGDDEWARAKTEADELIAEGIPYSMVRGNHDSSSKMRATFPYENTSYNGTNGGSYDGNIENSWQTIEFETTSGNMKYLLLSLDYAVSDAALTWAKGVIENHPDYNVIISTHAYMMEDGTRQSRDSADAPGYNNGDLIWEKLASQYENIVMVLSGHIASSAIVKRQSTGVHGNVVTEMLVDPQTVDLDDIRAGGDGTGMVCMLYFSADGTQVQVENYSTIKNKFYRSDSQFEMEVNSVASNTENINVSVAFDDEENKLNKRPDSVTVKLLRDEAEIERELILNKENNWAGSFADLERCDNEGKRYIYSIEAISVDGYVAHIDGTPAAGYKIVLTATDSSVKVMDYAKRVFYGDISEYRANGVYVAPTAPDGYVFAGWYQDATLQKSIGQDVIEQSAWAKFVPQQVLNSGIQIKYDTKLTSEATDIRLSTTVDNLRYSSVGMEVTINGVTKALEANTVYSTIWATLANGGSRKYIPSDIGDSCSSFFATAKIKNVPKSYFIGGIDVRTYWVTMDGTKVYGTKKVNYIYDGVENKDATLNRTVHSTDRSGSVILAKDASLTIGENTSKYGNQYLPISLSLPNVNGELLQIGSRMKDTNGVVLKVCKNDTGYYYNVYASMGQGRETISYAMAENIEGPWTCMGELSGMAEDSFTIHPGVIDFNGKSYLFYHNSTLSLDGYGPATGRRSICVDEMHYNEDGTIQTIEGLDE